jgi:Lipocalin-like domain
MYAGTITEGSGRGGEGMSDFDRFVGAWDLEEIEEIEDLLKGKRGPAPGFEKPSGLLIYLASGEMSVNFAGASRIHFLREFSPTPSELAAAGSAYGGYAGRWELEKDAPVVVHLPEVSFVPNRVGARVRRSYSFSRNLLFLRPITLSPAEKAPDRVLRWRRRL